MIEAFYGNSRAVDPGETLVDTSSVAVADPVQEKYTVEEKDDAENNAPGLKEQNSGHKRKKRMGRVAEALKGFEDTTGKLVHRFEGLEEKRIKS